MMASPTPQPQALALDNGSLAGLIKRIGSSSSVSDNDTNDRTLLDAATALPALFAAVSARLVLPSSSSSTASEEKDGDENDISDAVRHGLPSLTPLYLAKLLEVSGPDPAVALAAPFLATHLAIDRPLAHRYRALVLLHLLVLAHPPAATAVLTSSRPHSPAIIEALLESLELAADRGGAARWAAKPDLARVLLTVLEVVAAAAAIAAPVREALRPAEKWCRVVARSPGGGEIGDVARAVAANAAEKLAGPSSSARTTPAPASAAAAAAPPPPPTAAAMAADLSAALETLTSPTSPAVALDAAIESLALATLRPTTRARLVEHPRLPALLAPLLAKPASPTAAARAYPPARAFGMAVVLRNLVARAPPMTREQRELRRLAGYARRGMAKASQGERGSKEEESKEDDDEDSDAVVDARVKGLVRDHKLVGCLVGILRHLTLQQAPISAAITAAVAAAAESCSRVPPVRGAMVQQGVVPLLLRIARTDADAARALARCVTSLDPRLAVPEQAATTVAAMAWGLVSPLDALPSPPVLQSATNTQETTTRDAYEGLLALTNLSTLAALVPAHADWVSRLERSGTLVSDHPALRRAAWELLGNMLCCGTGALEAVVEDRPLLHSLLVRMGAAHAVGGDDDDDDDHEADGFAMRRASTGVLAMLSFAPPTMDLLLASHADLDNTPTAGGEDEDMELVTESVAATVISATRPPMLVPPTPTTVATVSVLSPSSATSNPPLLARLLMATRRERKPEIAHRLTQLWFNAVHDPRIVDWAAGSDTKLGHVLRDVAERFPENKEIGEIVVEAVAVLGRGRRARSRSTSAGRRQ
ncbi:hypothetical protein BC828DRAFT_391454 [Blastocladiella britannica]|nr:hypothetical protein BC828DRAFT_391454 [Blastocladiella britannica]